MTKRLPKIYTAFCLGMLLIVALLSRYKGELHLSSNGYALSYLGNLFHVVLLLPC